MLIEKTTRIAPARKVVRSNSTFLMLSFIAFLVKMEVSG